MSAPYTSQYSLRMRRGGPYVATCRLCGHQEVHDLSNGAEHLISTHVDDCRTDRVQRHADAYVTQGLTMEPGEALLTGMLMGLLARYMGEPDRAVRIIRAEPITDDQGNYSNMIRVTMESDAQFILHVTETNP